MEKPILIPELGDDIKTVKLVEWLVKKGDAVKKGEAIAVMETEKVAFEVEAPEDGVIEKLQFSEGDKVSVSKPIAYIAEDAENSGKLSRTNKDDAVEQREPASNAKPSGKGIRHIFKRITREK